jgi:hypothetical protein
VSQGKDLELKGRSRTEHRQKRGEHSGGNEGWGESSKRGSTPNLSTKSEFPGTTVGRAKVAGSGKARRRAS